MKYSFKVYGKIRGKARPRFNTKTGKAYKVKEDTFFEMKIKKAFLETGMEKSDKYIKMELLMFFSVPKSYSKKRRKNCIENIERPAKKPDVDNVLKNVCDALNKVAYDDDIQVIEVIAKKYYTDEDEDFMKIVIEEID